MYRLQDRLLSLICLWQDIFKLVKFLVPNLSCAQQDSIIKICYMTDIQGAVNKQIKDIFNCLRRLLLMHFVQQLVLFSW